MQKSVIRMIQVPSIAWALLAVLTLAAAEEARSQTVEYVVRIVELHSSTAIDFEPISSNPENSIAAIAAWQQAGVVRRLTTLRLTAVEGNLARGESVEEPRVLAEPSRFGGKLIDRSKLIPAMERKATSVSIRGRIEKDLIVMAYSCTNMMETEPDANATTNPGEAKPSIWKLAPVGNTAKTTISVDSGRTVLVGGVRSKTVRNSSAKEEHQAELQIITATVVR